MAEVAGHPSDRVTLTGPEAQQLYACPKGPVGAREQHTLSPDKGHLLGLFIAFYIASQSPFADVKL